VAGDCVIGLDIGTNFDDRRPDRAADNDPRRGLPPRRFFPRRIQDGPRRTRPSGWRNSCSILRNSLWHCRAARDRIRGVCVHPAWSPRSSFSDGAGNILRPSIQQSDGRAAAEVAELASEVEEAAFLARTGQWNQSQAHRDQAAVAGAS